MLPDTASPEVRTVTSFRVPLAAVTVMPADGSALLAPLAGVIVIAAAAALALAAALSEGPAEPPPPPPEHPTARKATAAVTAMPAARPARRTCAPFLRRIVGPPSGCIVVAGPALIVPVFCHSNTGRHHQRVSQDTRATRAAAAGQDSMRAIRMYYLCDAHG